ncbi:SLC13 family permease [Gordonia sp. NPDC003429]
MIGVHTPLGTIVSVAILLVVIVTTLSTGRVMTALVAVAAAIGVLVVGLTTVAAARTEMTGIGPTIVFLAAMLVIADICSEAGVFDWVGGVISGACRGSPIRLLQIVFVVAALTTAVLSLDTTTVLLTPVAVLAARRVGVAVAPIGMANSHLANSASTLLPISNLTNLLAFGATGLSFARFTGLMAAPFMAAVVVEYLVFRWFFAEQLSRRAAVASAPDTGAGIAAPSRSTRAALAALVVLLVAFVVAEPLGIPLYLVATIGAVVMVIPSLRRAPGAAVQRTISALNVPFLVFVAALGVIILPVREGSVGDLVAHLLPTGTGLLALLGAAALAAVLANLLNNLPATLLLVPLVAHQPALVLAVLIGVNIGPNLTYFGSLANLLWRDVLRRQSIPPRSRTHLALGVVSVPPTLVAAVLALWVGLWM